MAVKVEKLSSEEHGSQTHGAPNSDADVKLVEGGLYRLDDGTIVIATYGRHFTKKMFVDSVWKSWALPDTPPYGRSDMNRVYTDDWFDDDAEDSEKPYKSKQSEFFLMHPQSGAFKIDPETFDPTAFGGVKPTTLDDPRIVHVVNADVVVVRLKDVPENAERSIARLSLPDLLKDIPENAVGHTRGPKSSIAAPDEFTRMYLRDLPAATRPTPQIELPIAAQYKHGNSGRLYTFEAGINNFTNELGWKPLDLAGDGKGPAFDPVAPVMAIHDLMEHFPGDEYEPHNEYMAQGAMLWLRSEGGFFGNANVPDTVMKPAFGMLFHHIIRGKLKTKTLDEVMKDSNERLNALNHGMPAGTFFTLNELAFKAKQFISATYSYSDQRNLLEQSVVNGLPWVTIGYRRAIERYKGLNRGRLVALYKDAVEQISRVKPGSKLRLTLNYEKYSADIEITTSAKG